MAHLEQRRWPEEASGWTRRDRRPCEYAVYRPDAVAGRGFVIDGDVAADVADAEAALVYLDASVSALGNTEALARLLLRAECVASSRIEGLEVGARRLLRADAARTLGDPVSDVTAGEVLANIDAMSWGLGAVEPRAEITLETLLETHRRLMAGTRLSEHGGRIRTQQNWIGGSDFNPCSAAFVPPPPDAVPGLLEDLMAFCNEDMLPALAQAAIAHAQFETIHPFVDGNGRTGRVLLHLVLRRRRLGVRIVAPISLVLATWATDYVGGLMGTRYVGPADSPAAMAGVNRWVALLASACGRAVEDAGWFEARVRELQASWIERVGPTRRDSTVRHLIQALAGMPVLSTASAARATDRSFQATSQAVKRLADAGVLRQITVGRRNRAFEAPELIDTFTTLERRLASPTADTRVAAADPRSPAPSHLAQHTATGSTKSGPCLCRFP